MLRLLLISAVVGYAQSLPRIAIAASDAGIVVGTTEKLKVVVRDAAGNIVNNPVVTWTSQQPALLRVDNQGSATAIGVGLCTVTANSGGFIANAQLQCIPARIDLQPEEKDIAVGERIAFEAKALDAAGQPIPNVTFNWQITGANGGQINAARIDTAGQLTALGTGHVTVRARIDVSGGGQPGRLQWIWGVANVRIAPKKFYSVRRLVGSDDVRHAFTLRSTGQTAAINDNGQAAFIGSADGIATALFQADRGVTKLLLQGGTVLFGGVAAGPVDVSINNNGDILARHNIDPFGSGAIALYSGGRLRYPLIQGQSFSNYENIRPDLDIPGCLNDSGQIVFRGVFNFSGSNRQYNGLFRQTDRAIELLVSNETGLPGIAAANFNFDRFGIDNSGAVYFLASAGGAQGLYRIQLSGQPERLIGTVAPAPLVATSIQRGSFAVEKEGGVVTVANIAGRARIVRYRGGQFTQSDGAGATFINQIFQSSTSAGVVYYACAAAGCGAYRWKDAQTSPLVIVGRLAANGEPIRDVLAASINASGVVTAHVSTTDSPFLLMQQSGTSSSKIVQSGDILVADVGVQLPPGNTIVRSGGADPIYAGLGTPQSLFEIDGGDLIPQLAVGDRLTDGTAYQGGLIGSPSGGVYFQADGAIYRFQRGVIETVVRPGARLTPDATLRSASIRSVNANGGVVMQASIAPSGQGFYLIESGRITEILRLETRAANGRVFNQINGMLLDDNNRVSIAARVDGQTQESSYFWSNGAFENAFPPGRLNAGGMSFNNVGFRVARGNRIYAFANVPGSSDQGILEHSGGGWNLAVGNANPMPDGSLNVGISSWDANPQGEIAFVIQSATPLAMIARTASGELRQVLSMLEPMPNGDYLQSIRDVHFRDDGRIVFTAFDTSGRFALYVAEPLP